MNNDFNLLEWHDAIIERVELDRTSPGERDRISLTIRWPDDRRSKLHFDDCYKLVANMNFGIIAHECVLTASEVEASRAPEGLGNFWPASGTVLSSLRLFSIETNSTASKIDIVALSWSIEDLS